MKKTAWILAFVLLLSLFAGCQTTQLSTTAPETTNAPVSTAAPETHAAATTAETPMTTEAPTTEAPTAAPTAETTPAETGDDAVHPMLFHVTGENGQEMYLFGTIHVGDKRTKVALQKLTPFLDRCDALAVEFDIVAYEDDKSAQMQAMTMFYLLDGSTVDQYMPAELFDRSANLLRKAQLYPSLMKHYNLSMWSQLVEQAALLTTTKLDAKAGMDRLLIKYCYQKQIPVRDVESPELQYGLLASFSDELNLLLIENTLERLDGYGAEVDALYSAWVGGDYDDILAVLNGEDDAQTEEMNAAQKALVEDYNNKMLTQRNLGMRDKAVQWLTAGDKVFFAVGAAHLVDEGGLVELLRAAGYTVEQLKYG